MRIGDHAYATLLTEIQNGDLPPGSVLSEVEQSTRLGISRTPVRQAISRLTADGLAIRQSPRMTVVSSLDGGEVRALFEARRALEEAAVRLAAIRGDRSVFDGLAHDFEIARVDDAADVEAYYGLIARFDAAIDVAVANEYLAAPLRILRTHLVRVRGLARDNHDRLQTSIAEHRDIAAAVAAGDPELAAHATHLHLHHALTAILAALDPEPGSHPGH